MDVGLRETGRRLSGNSGRGGSLAKRHSSSTTPSACRSTSCRMRRAIRVSRLIRLDLITRWTSRAIARALPGKVRRSRRRILLISSCRSQNSKAIGRRGLTAARCWPSLIRGRGASELKAGEEGEVILDHTPFYAESGGQVGDRGWFYSDDHNTVVAEVKGCYYPIQGVRAHQVVVKSPPSKTRRVGHPQGRRQGGCGREHRHPRSHHAQSHGDASAAGGTARGSGQAREAGGVAGRAGASAV